MHAARAGSEAHARLEDGARCVELRLDGALDLLQGRDRRQLIQAAPRELHPDAHRSIEESRENGGRPLRELRIREDRLRVERDDDPPPVDGLERDAAEAAHAVAPDVDSDVDVVRSPSRRRLDLDPVDPLGLARSDCDGQAVRTSVEPHLGRPFGIATTDVSLHGETPPHIRERQRLRRNERLCPRQVDVAGDVDMPHGTPPRHGIVETPPDDDAFCTEVELPDVTGVCVHREVDIAIVDRRIEHRSRTFHPAHREPAELGVDRRIRDASTNRALASKPENATLDLEVIPTCEPREPPEIDPGRIDEASKLARVSRHICANGLTNAADLGALDAKRGRSLDSHQARARFEFLVGAPRGTELRVTDRHAREASRRRDLDTASGVHRREVEPTGTKLLALDPGIDDGPVDRVAHASVGLETTDAKLRLLELREDDLHLGTVDLLLREADPGGGVDLRAAAEASAEPRDAMEVGDARAHDRGHEPSILRAGARDDVERDLGGHRLLVDPRPELRRLAGKPRSHLCARDRLPIDRAGERVDRRLAADAALVDRDVRARVEPEVRSQCASGHRPEVDVARRHDALHAGRRARLHDGAGHNPRLAEGQRRLAVDARQLAMGLGVERERLVGRKLAHDDARLRSGRIARVDPRIQPAIVQPRLRGRLDPSDLSVECRLDVDALPAPARHHEPPADRPLRVESTRQPARDQPNAIELGPHALLLDEHSPREISEVGVDPRRVRDGGGPVHPRVPETDPRRVDTNGPSRRGVRRGRLGWSAGREGLLEPELPARIGVEVHVGVADGHRRQVDHDRPFGRERRAQCLDRSDPDADPIGVEHLAPLRIADADAHAVDAAKPERRDVLDLHRACELARKDAVHLSRYQASGRR